MSSECAPNICILRLPLPFRRCQCAASFTTSGIGAVVTGFLTHVSADIFRVAFCYRQCTPANVRRYVLRLDSDKFTSFNQNVGKIMNLTQLDCRTQWHLEADAKM